MKCPYCASAKQSVVDKRNLPDGSVRRRRECLTCKKRYTTYERVEEIQVYVVKKDSSKELFSTAKVLSGIVKACQKRPVSQEEQKKMADAVASAILAKNKNEVATHDVGDQVMKQLRKVDKVAYIRFASIYKNFEDVDEFKEELKKLEKR
jgi:transcriptional repressor NrdR